MGSLEIGIVALIAFALLIPVAILTVMILRLRVLLQKRSDDPDKDTALRILRERYARGEIDEDEYRKRRQMLESENP